MVNYKTKQRRKNKNIVNYCRRKTDFSMLIFEKIN